MEKLTLVIVYLLLQCQELIVPLHHTSISPRADLTYAMAMHDGRTHDCTFHSCCIRGVLLRCALAACSKRVQQAPPVCFMYMPKFIRDAQTIAATTPSKYCIRYILMLMSFFLCFMNYTRWYLFHFSRSSSKIILLYFKATVTSTMAVK